MGHAFRLRTSALLALLFSLLVVAFTFPTFASATKVPLFGDLLVFIIPTKRFLGDQLRQGDLPLWNPFLFMGTPFLAKMHTGVFYPPSALLTLPFPLGFNVFVSAHYVAALTGCWRFLRDRELGLAATAIGALTFTIGGYLVSLLNIPKELQGAAWVPWILFAGTRWQRHPTIGRAAALTALFALQILGGAIETFLMTLAVLGALLAYRTPRSALKEVAVLACLIFAAVAISAAQILPTSGLLAESSRRTGFTFEEATVWSLRPISLLQLVLPNRCVALDATSACDLRPGLEDGFQMLLSIYLGVVPLCLVACGMLLGRERVFWSAVIAVGGILALGKHSPAFNAFFEAVPLLAGRFRYPEKLVLLAHVGAMVAAAEGAERLFRSERRTSRLVLLIALTLALVPAAIASLGWLRPALLDQAFRALSDRELAPQALARLVPELEARAHRSLFVLGGFALMLIARMVGLLEERYLRALTVVLAIGDPALANRDLNQSARWADLRESPSVVDVEALRASHQRVFHYQLASTPGPPRPGLAQWWPIRLRESDWQSFYSTALRIHYLNAGMAEQIGSIGGQDGIWRRSEAVFHSILPTVPQDVAVRLLEIFGGAYLIGPDALEAPSLEEVRPSPELRVRIYRTRNPLPIAYAVSELRQAPSDIEAFNFLIGSGFDPKRAAVVERLPDGWVDQRLSETKPNVSILSYEADRVRVRARHDSASFLILNDSYDDAWQANLDDRPAPIVRTNALVRGVALPPGDHVIEFVYRPATLRFGLWLSAASLALGLVSAIAMRRWR